MASAFRVCTAISAFIWIFLHSAVMAGELEDCLLSSLKGVSSDAAARMVRQACESKVTASRAERLIAKHGEKTSTALTVTDWAKWGSMGPHTVIRNTSSLTALLVEVSLSKPDSKGNCTESAARKELYRVKIKPGSSGTLLFGDVDALVSKTGGICIDAVMVRGRQPSAFDFSIGAFEPLSPGEIEMVNDELNERYAQIPLDFRWMLQTTPPASRK